MRRALALPFAALLLTSTLLAGPLAVPAAAAAHHKALETVKIRAGDHNGLSRVLISWAQIGDYKIDESPGTVTVTFAHGGHGDLGNSANQTLRNITSIAATDDPSHLVVTLSVKSGSHVRSFKAGNMLVVDLQDGDSGAGAPAPVDATASSGQKTEIAKPADTVIHVAPSDPLSLAAFRRGPYLWIVADGKLPPAVPVVTGLEGSALAQPLRFTQDGATLLRYTIADTDHVSAKPHGGGWDVTLSPDATTEKGLDVEGRIATDQIKITAPGAMKVLPFTDPDLGDAMQIVTLPSAGEYVDRDRHLAESDILTTGQGIVVISKGLSAVTTGSNSVAVSNLNLSGDIGTTHSTPAPLFDLAIWRAGGPLEIVKRRKAIEHAGLADGEAATRGTAIDLAHLFVANGFGNEALGTLDIAAIADPDLPKNMDFLALRGAANALAGRAVEATADLSSDGLRDNPEASLWTAFANFDGPLDKKQTAFAVLASGAETIGKYPPELRQRFALALASLAVEKLDLPAMKAALELLTRDGAEPATEAAVATLKGAIDVVGKKPEQSERHFATAISKHDDFWQSEALVASVDDGLARNAMSNKDAIAKLEQVRFGWRGDDLELKVLSRLGDLYLAQGDYRNALDVLAELKLLAPDTAYAATAQDGIVQAGRHAFAADKEASLAPLDALDLYYTLSEALPPNTIPNDDIRVLSDRLAGIGVVDKAATLLEPQMKVASDAVVKARLANRIAALRLLDDRPDQALTALDTGAPAADAKLPDTLRVDRQLLLARALSKNGKPDNALAALQGLTTREADALRVDIAWSQHNWKLSAEALARLAGDMPADGKLNPQQSSIVLNEAVALSLANDPVGLQKLRDTYLASMSRTDKSGAFSLLTSSNGDMHAPDVDAVRASVTGLDIFENFLGSYRKEPGKA